MGDKASLYLNDLSEIQIIFTKNKDVREIEEYFIKWTKRINKLIGDKDHDED